MIPLQAYLDLCHSYRSRQSRPGVEIAETRGFVLSQWDCALSYVLFRFSHCCRLLACGCRHGVNVEAHSKHDRETERSREPCDVR